MHADSDRREREELNAARKRGDILALSEILDRLPGGIGDNVIEVEIDREHGRFLYEIYYLGADGRRREITVDARDASILERGDD
ncbi:PepSY domain-containing protein [Oricola thermophila]|uniref:Peptidase n=1 Tax=Oricola thermophila TaxID=2742145 RepID=A0A6N1VEX8_9HYPH|nr:PepSY domain-containing protein [Oricola thermophila]QKV19258.1 peptidase [Oricola thermophila]